MKKEILQRYKKSEQIAQTDREQRGLVSAFVCSLAG